MKALAHVKPALTKTDSDPKLRRDSVSEASVEDIQDISNKNPWININWGKCKVNWYFCCLEIL